MSVRKPHVPAYRLHKPSGQAVVTLGGRDFYLGKFGSPGSRAEYGRLVAEWLAAGRPASTPPPTTTATTDLAVAELILAYARHAEAYYVKNGRPTTEVRNIRLALRPLRHLYGHTAARDFGPLALKAVRQAMIDDGLCRAEVNKRVRHVVRAFKWGVENELVPAAVHQALKAVEGLRKGRSEARESEPVRPVPDAAVDAVRPFVAPQVWAMIQLQRLTGMRPGEAVIMRTRDIDVSGRVWVYTPHSHKTEHHGKGRHVYLGPRAQEVLRPWLRTDLSAYLFSPREAAEYQRARRRKPGKKAAPPNLGRKRAPGDCYHVTSYAHAIARACDRAFPYPGLDGSPVGVSSPDQDAEREAWRKAHRWHPHQLRHSAATWLRKEFGLDVARVILGHSSASVTEVYAEVDRDKAIGAMERVG